MSSQKPRFGTKQGDLSSGQSQIHALARDFDVISDTNTHTGDWDGIMVLVYKTDMFIADGCKVKDVVKDLTDLNTYNIEGIIIPGNFTQIKIGDADAVVIAWKN